MVMKTEQPRPRMIGGKNQVERWPQLVIVPGTKPTHPTPQIYRSANSTVGLLGDTNRMR